MRHVEIATNRRILAAVDDLDLEIIAEWLALAQVVAAHSDKLREDIARVLDNWMSIVRTAWFAIKDWLTWRAPSQRRWSESEPI